MQLQYFLRHSFTVVKIDVSNLEKGFVEQLDDPAIKRMLYGSL